MFYRFTRFLIRQFCKLFFHLKIENSQILPKKGPFILASNHISNLDPPVVGATCPPLLNFLAKEELFYNKLGGWYMRRLNTIPLNRKSGDIGALRLALKILKTKPLAVFPQGTREESLDDFKSGVGFLYKKTRVPLFVARVFGTEEILPKGASFFKPGTIRIVFGSVEGLDLQDSYEEVALKVMKAIKSLK